MKSNSWLYIIITILVMILLFIISAIALDYFDILDINLNSGSVEESEEYDEQPDRENQPDKTVQEYMSNKGVTVKILQPDLENSVECPIEVIGEVPGSWYFEAQFEAKLFNSNGLEVDSALATANEDWMTSDPVQFTTILTCDNSCGANGQIELVKSNPSDLPQNDDIIEIAVQFSDSCK